MNDSDNDSFRFQLSRKSKRKIYSSIVIAVILVLTLGQPHAGFLVLVLLLPFTVWLAYSAYVIAMMPYARRAQIICIFVWLVAMGLVSASHYVWHSTARRNADEVVQVVSYFTAKYGRCPQSLEMLGIKREQLEEKLGDNFGYACTEGKPRLSYVVTFTIFDTYAYDFDQRVWNYESWSEKKKFLDTSPPGSRSASDRKRGY